MQTELQQLKENSFINKFDWYSLSCLDKPKCIISESILKNSSYLYLLLKGKDAWYLKERDNKIYRDFLETETQINFNLCLGNKKNFREELYSFINNGEYIILPSDNFYREHCASYNRNHHIHFITLKGYDFNSKKFIIIDEDRSKEYYKSQNFSDGVIYNLQYIDNDLLERICSCDQLAGNENAPENTYPYFKVSIKPTIPSEYDLKNVKRLYAEHIKDTIQSYPDYIRAFKESIPQTKKQNEENNKVFLSNPNFYASWVVFPGDSEMLQHHYYSLHTQRRFFDLMLKECDVKEALMKAFDETLSKYFVIRNIILKCVLSNNVHGFDRSISCFDDIPTIELGLYNLILSSLNMLF